MGLYVRSTRIEQLLLGKVDFVDDDTDPNHLSRKMLKALVDEAEAQVELDLGVRYVVPFRAVGELPFDTLPRHTKRMIVLLCEIMAQIRCLETDFGRGSAIGGEAYTQVLQKRYDTLVNRCIGRYGEEDKRFGAFMYPPLDQLQRAAHNTASDDGFGGMVLSGSMSGDRTSFPVARITDPSNNFGHFEPEPLDE